MKHDLKKLAGRVRRKLAHVSGQTVPTKTAVTSTGKKSPFEAHVEAYTAQLLKAHDGKIEVGDARRTLAYLPPLNGYSAPFSVAQGEKLFLHLARNKAAPAMARNHAFQLFSRQLKVPVKRRILVDPVSNTHVSQVSFPEGITCRNEWPKSHGGEGAGYAARFSINTASLSPGLYEARFIEAADVASEGIYFNVRPSDPEKDMLVVILPTLTWQAYNRCGGGSFYSAGIGQKREVSMNRPVPHKYADSLAYCLPYLRLLREQSIPHFCITSEDLHNESIRLADFKAAAILTHDEYYTDTMYCQLQEFLHAGGRLVAAGGNSLYRRAHPSAEGRDVSAFHVNYGEYFADPARRDTVDNSRAEETLVGLTYAYGGWPLERGLSNRNLISHSDAALVSEEDLAKARGYQIADCDHWLFTGTDVKVGEVIGSESPVMEIEIDAVRLREDGSPDRDRCREAPEDLHVLATTEVLSKHFGRERVGCLVEAGVGGGRVLNFGTVGLVLGLYAADRTITKMVSNAFNWAVGNAIPASQNARKVQFGIDTQDDKESYDEQSYREDQSTIAAHYERIFKDFFGKERVQGKTIVDIGPGLEHYFVDILRDNGATVWTIDFSMDVVAKSRERQINAIAADLRTFQLGLLEGRFDGVFCRGSFNPFWFDRVADVEERARAICAMAKPEGWIWVAPYNAISQFSGRTDADKEAVIDAQRRGFEALGCSTFELDSEQQRLYRITRAMTHPLFVRNLPTQSL